MDQIVDRLFPLLTYVQEGGTLHISRQLAIQQAGQGRYSHTVTQCGLRLYLPAFIRDGGPDDSPRQELAEFYLCPNCGTREEFASCRMELAAFVLAHPS